MKPDRATKPDKPLTFRSIRGWSREVRRVHPNLPLREVVVLGYELALDEELGYKTEKLRSYD